MVNYNLLYSLSCYSFSYGCTIRPRFTLFANPTLCLFSFSFSAAKFIPTADHFAAFSYTASTIRKILC